MRNWNISPFLRLGEWIDSSTKEAHFTGELERISKQLAIEGFYSYENIFYAVKAIREKFLEPYQIQEWLGKYIDFSEPKKKLSVGVIMAGNIPLVGFFDLMCVTVFGYKCYYKPSSKDKSIMDLFVEKLKSFGADIELFETILNPDAVIATGSDNTVKYFQASYSDLPLLVRGSRYSVAVLSGKEKATDIFGLAEDIFTHNSMGCRSVNMIFAPTGYDLHKLAFELSRHCPENDLYKDCYRYNKAVWKTRGEEIIDAEKIIFVDNKFKGLYTQNIGEIYYGYYDNLNQVNDFLEVEDSRIQCVVSDVMNHSRAVKFSEAQYPDLWNYADGIDVMEWLNKLKK